MKVRYVTALLGCFLFGLLVESRVLAHCPTCFGCETCFCPVCLDDDSKCTGCCYLCVDALCLADPLLCSGCCDDCSNCQCVDNDSLCSGCCRCQNCSCVPDDSKCGDPDCWDCDNNCDCQCDITINSVSSDDYACVGCDVTFTANVTGSCSCVDWSGGGDPASASGTCSFTTHWDTPGTKTVTASPDCGSSEQKQVTIAAPNNFRETYREERENGELYFEYRWGSTSGILAHLQGCKVGEKVDYPGGDDPYCFPSPPWSHCWDNPTTAEGSATAGFGTDTHLPGTFVTPYQVAFVPATQIYRYKSCTGNCSTLMGPLSINRYVTGWNPLWRYSIIKSGAYAEIFPLP